MENNEPYKMIVLYKASLVGNGDWQGKLMVNHLVFLFHNYVPPKNIASSISPFSRPARAVKSKMLAIVIRDFSLQMCVCV